MFKLNADHFILSSATFLLMISTDDGTFVFILLLLGSKLKLMLESMQVLFQFEFSECFSGFAF